MRPWIMVALIGILAGPVAAADGPTYLKQCTVLHIPTSVGPADVYIGETTVYRVGDDHDDDISEAVEGRIQVKYRGTAAWNNKEIRIDNIHIPIKYSSSNHSAVDLVDKLVPGEEQWFAMPGGFTCDNPGTSKIMVTIENHSVSFMMNVVKLPINMSMSSGRIAAILGPPDIKATSDQTTTHRINGVEETIHVQNWIYTKKYPGLILAGADPWGLDPPQGCGMKAWSGWIGPEWGDDPKVLPTSP